MAQVWFCLACDDQPPWKDDILRPCPTCQSTADVKKAQRFGNLFTDAEGNPHETDKIERREDDG
jgi:hypothetical protein